jgi:PAS domain S-box-containing protein
LRSLADSIPNLAWIADAGGARIWFNRRWREYTGLREEETAGWGWMQVHDPDQASQIVERYKRQIESGDFWEDTVRLRGKTGEYRWFLSRAIPIRGSDGRPVRWFGTSTDVTTEMEARDRLRQSEERATSRASELQAIMDAVPAAIYIAREPDCRELIGNRAAREWLGLSPAEPVRDPLRAAVRDVRPVYNYECEVASEDGSRKALLGNTVPLLDDQGHSRGGVAAFIDVTESRRMQDRLREAQRLESVGLLAGGVAHDFNNLLVPILGYAGVARDTLELSSPVQPLLAEIERAAERAAHLTRQMLAYAGKARFVIQQIDVEKVARETVSLLRVSISKDISIAVHAEPPIPAVDADPAEVEQVLMNLLLNAAEAIGDGPGTIEIRLAAEDLAGPEAAGFQVASDIAPGRYVRVEVTDTGCGMDAETRAKIFEPFFSTKFLGRGLGLAAVAGIVRAHGWGLRVTSAPGEGSTFQVFLHAARAEAARPPAASAEATVDPSGSGSVLVVDDEDVVLQTAKLALERHGYRVFLARSGADAVRLYQGEARDVDLVLLDLGMPGMNGHETLVALQEINPDVRALISSGYSESEALEPFAGQKTVGFMQKPYAAGQLASAVKKALRDRPSPSGRASA